VPAEPALAVGGPHLIHVGLFCYELLPTQYWYTINTTPTGTSSQHATFVSFSTHLLPRRQQVQPSPTKARLTDDSMRWHSCSNSKQEELKLYSYPAVKLGVKRVSCSYPPVMGCWGFCLNPDSYPATIQKAFLPCAKDINRELSRPPASNFSFGSAMCT
jgi:hypothetical protein